MIALLAPYCFVVDFNNVRAQVLARFEAAREEILGGELAVVIEAVEDVLPLICNVVQVGVAKIQVSNTIFMIMWIDWYQIIVSIAKLVNLFLSFKIVHRLILSLPFSFQHFAVVRRPKLVFRVIMYDVRQEMLVDFLSL